MKICFIGLGSIGVRHLKNICEICKVDGVDLEVHALRSGNNKLRAGAEELINKQVFSYGELDNDYDIAFITNPTSMHFDTIHIMKEKTKNMFIEKPIFSSTDTTVDDLGDGFNGVYYIAAPMRYTSVMNKLKEDLKDVKVYSVRAICSTYLPEWRPGVDYRNVYSAKKELGGGISIDCIHEWDYLVELFGLPEEVVNFQGQYSNLEIDSDDISIYIAKYKDKLLELHLDYIGRIPQRYVEIYTDKGNIIGDFMNFEVRYSFKDNIKFENDDNEIYIRELRYFLSCINSIESNKNDMKHAYNILKLAKGEL